MAPTPPTDPSPLERAMALLEQALAQPEEARSGFLDGACANDAPLRRDVQSLLESHAARAGFMADPTVDLTEHDGHARASTPAGERPGTIIDRYKLLQHIGEGGFGDVFMAEQTAPVVRRVALKVIKLGMDTRQVIARFEAERQALAMMDHPNIARILDGGTTASGRPYFVMELVNGVPLTEYCDAHNLSVRDRLAIFKTVCDAVQHAHNKGIIHRDLKPSNVLVTIADGRPFPKVIDFGIAKATNARLTAKTLFTEFRQLIGTPEYMSPEQAEPAGVDIDTRSDVYALGVLLYELLTGTTPFDSTRLRSQAYGEIQRIIREEHPDRPSTRVATLETRASVAQQRHTDAERLTRSIRGDLDWIVMRALDKDRSRRYPTATSFGDDIERFLTSRPVEASPPSNLYRISRFAQRHRRSIGVGAVVLGATVVIGAVLTLDAIREHERQTKHTAAVSATIERASLLLGEAINAPIDADGEWARVRTEGDRLRGLLELRAPDPDARTRAAAFLDTLSARSAERTLAVRIERAGDQGASHPDHESWVRMRDEFKAALRDFGIDLDRLPPERVASLIREHPAKRMLADALELWMSTLARTEPRPDGGDAYQVWYPVLLEADDDPVRRAVRRLQFGPGPPAPPGYRPTRAELQRVIDSPGLATAHPRTYGWLGFACAFAGEPQLADAVFRRGLLRYPDDHTLNHDYAYGLSYQGRYDEAIIYYARCVALRPDTGGMWRSLGNAYREVGRFSDAVDALTKATQIQPDHAGNHTDLAAALLDAKQPDSALISARRAVNITPASPETHVQLGHALRALGRTDEAISTYEHARTLPAPSPGWDPPIDEWVRDCQGTPER